MASASGAQHSQRFVRHRFVGGEYLFSDAVRQRKFFSVFQIARTAFQNLVRRAFRELYQFSADVADNAHHLSQRVERRFSDTPVFSDGVRQPVLGRIVDKRAFRRLSDSRSVLARLRVGADRHCRHEFLFVVRRMLDNGHPVLSEGTGLVRTYDLRASERFDCGQPSYDRIALRHFRHAH